MSITEESTCPDPKCKSNDFDEVFKIYETEYASESLYQCNKCKKVWIE